MDSLQNSKLIHYFQALKKNELARFAKFLNSPYHNNSENITRLFDYLRRQYPDFETHKLERGKVYKKVFGKQVYDYKTLENHQSRLMVLLQRFMTLEELNVRTQDRELLELKMLHTRGLDRYFEGEVQKFKGHLAKGRLRNAEFHLGQYESSDMLLFHPRIDTTKSKVELHNKMAYSLDAFYLINSLKIRGEQLMAQRDLTVKIDLNFKDEIEKMADNPLFEKEPLLQMYRLNLQLFYTPDYSIYQELKALLLAHLGALTFSDKETLYSYLLAHTGHLGLSQSANWRAYFELYKIGFQENILLSNEKILAPHFLNAVVLAVELKEINWLANFLKSEVPRLAEEDQEKCNCLGKAYHAYAKGDFEACIQVLYQVEAYKRDPYFALRVFPLELRANFELAAKFQGDEFLSIWKRYRNYILDNKEISQQRIAANYNFLTISKKLYKAIYKTIDKEKLQNEIINLEPMIGKAWCLEKL